MKKIAITVLIVSLLWFIGIVIYLNSDDNIILTNYEWNKLMEVTEQSLNINLLLYDELERILPTVKMEAKDRIEQIEAYAYFIKSINVHLSIDEARLIAFYGVFYAEYYNYSPEWNFAIMWQESHFKRNERSSVGAIGLMQVYPVVWMNTNNPQGLHNFDINNLSQLYDIKTNIKSGSYIFSHYLKQGQKLQITTGLPKNINSPEEYALQRYFGGSHSNIVTQRYSAQVLAKLEHYKKTLQDDM